MTSLFFSYSHKDEGLRDELEVHLAMLKREGVIDVWHDRKIPVGNEFDRSISDQLETADVILLLVSPDFLASSYCYDIEVRRAMERHEAGSARVVPVILRPCDWHGTPFAKLLAAPKDGKPVTKWADRDEAFLDVVRQIRAALDGRKPVPKKPPSSVPSPMRAIVRSSNLRLKKEFTEADEARFLDDAFDYIARFFENSLAELQDRNSGIETRFKMIDGHAFSALIYRNGKAVARGGLRNASGRRFMGGITFSTDDSAPENSCQESLMVEAGDQALFLTASFGAVFRGGSDAKKHMTMEGAAEYYWKLLIDPLQ